MTQWAGLMGLLVFWGTLIGEMGQTMDKLERWQNRIIEKKIAHQNLLGCAQNRANLRNIEDARYLLLEVYPNQAQEIHRAYGEASELIESFVSPGGCRSSLFPHVEGGVHREYNPLLPRYWPNWVGRLKSLP